MDTVILETTAIRHITFFVLMGFDNYILDYSIVVSDFLYYMRILLMIITLKKMWSAFFYALSQVVLSLLNFILIWNKVDIVCLTSEDEVALEVII